MAMEEKQPSGDFEAYESVTSIINPRRSTFEELAGLTQENIFNPGYRVTICIRKGQDSIRFGFENAGEVIPAERQADLISIIALTMSKSDAVTITRSKIDRPDIFLETRN